MPRKAGPHTWASVVWCEGHYWKCLRSGTRSKPGGGHAESRWVESYDARIWLTFLALVIVSNFERGARSATRSESADEDEVEQETRPDSQRSEYVIVPSSQPAQREEPSSTQATPEPSDQGQNGGGNGNWLCRFLWSDFYLWRCPQSLQWWGRFEGWVHTRQIFR